MKEVKVNDISLSNQSNFALIAGLNVLEDKGIVNEVTEELKKVTKELGIPFIFKASYFPVEAPEGTYASEELLSESITSAATVGFPRESKTSKAKTSLIVNLVTINLSLSLEKFLLTYQYYLPDLKILLNFVKVKHMVHHT